MNANCKVELETIRGLIELAHGFDVKVPEMEIEPWEPIVCTRCGGTLKLYALVLKDGRVIRPG